MIIKKRGGPPHPNIVTLSLIRGPPKRQRLSISLRESATYRAVSQVVEHEGLQIFIQQCAAVRHLQRVQIP